MQKEDLSTVMKLKLASMDDLVRMAFFTAGKMAGLNLLLYTEKKKWFIGFLTGVAGYFDLRGLPMYFYVELEEKPKNAKFIKYSSHEGEKWGFADSTATSTTSSYLPIIELAEKPAFF
jgi:hypothetical protein